MCIVITVALFPVTYILLVLHPYQISESGIPISNWLSQIFLTTLYELLKINLLPNQFR